jgi:hypothetical protein
MVRVSPMKRRWAVQGVGHDDAFAAEPTVDTKRVTSFMSAAVSAAP